MLETLRNAPLEVILKDPKYGMIPLTVPDFCVDDRSLDQEKWPMGVNT